MQHPSKANTVHVRVTSNGENVPRVGVNLRGSNATIENMVATFVNIMIMYSIRRLYHETADVSYTYSNNYNEAFSTLDHILLSKSLSDYIVNYSSLRENVENQSDHAPVVLSLKIFYTIALLYSK